jgi:hypothetical protein
MVGMKKVIDIKRKNRLVKVCYVASTSATSSKAFLLPPLTVLTGQTRQSVHAINQSIFLRCLWKKVLAEKIIFVYLKQQNQ